MRHEAQTEWRAGTRRGAEGFFHIAQRADGRWALLDPDGKNFFLRAVHGVRAPRSATDGEPPADPASRLRAWGFNAAGLGGDDDAGRADGLAWIGSADFLAAGSVLAGPGLRLPDVFDPEWPRRAQARAAEVCAPFAAERALIGWAGDAALEWAQPAAAGGRPALLQQCLSLEPGFAAYHAAWEFALAPHGGRLAALARAWDTPLANREVVRALTRAEQAIATRGYLRDDARWTRELARRYFSGAGAAVRAADGNHLFLGARCLGRAGPHAAAEAAFPAADAALADWRELPARAAAAQPLIADTVGWSGAEFLRPLAGGRVGRLTTVERMLRRARAGLARLERNPAVVGYAWARWEDEPGEQPPFAGGLVHANGAEAREHIELIARFNARMAG